VTDFYQRMIDFTRDGVYRYRYDDGTLLAANRGLVRILGLSCEPSELLGKRLRDVMVYTEPEGTVRRAASATGEIHGLEYHFKTLSGKDRWVVHDSFLVHDPRDGEVVEAIVKDVTSHKLAVEALRRTSQLLDAAQATAGVGGWELDPVAGKLYWTAETYRIHDTSPEEYQPEVESAIAFYAPESEPIIRAAVQEAIVGGTPFDLELELVTAKGRRIWAHATSRVTVENGRTVKVTGAFQDITERRRAADELRRLNADLEERVRERTAQLEIANHDLEAFAYSVSHDLRAPLRTIDGFSQILLQEHASSLDAEGRRYLQLVRAGAQEMGQLIDDLLRLSRLTRQAPVLGPMSMDDAVGAALDVLSRDREGREIRLEVAPLPPCTGDPALLKQVWTNLLSNALKFTSKRESALVQVGSRTENDRPVYFVRDNGAGFDMRYQDKLFRVFQRLHRADQFEGNGIGLAIVALIVERHGGRIWARGETDRGAEFCFTIGGAS